MATYSAQMVADMMARETGEAILVLVTISHALLPTPIRVTSDAVDTVSRGPLTAADLTSNGYDITLNRAEMWAAGLLGSTGLQGLEQDISYYGTVPIGALDTLNDLTAEGIITPERLAAAGTHRPTLIHARSGANNEFRIQLGLALPSNNAFRVITNNGTEVIWSSADGMPDLADGIVRRFALTRNGTTGALELWTQPEGSSTATSHGSKTSGSGLLDLTGHTLHVGRSGAGGADSQWKGRYDDLRIWSDIRSQSEIETTAFVELIGNEPGLNAYWPMTEGTVFQQVPFEFILPDGNRDRAPRARLAVDNVHRDIVDSLRAIDTPPDLLFELVRGSAPDTLEHAWKGFRLTQASYDVLRVEGEITVEDFSREPWPWQRYTPDGFPALF